MGTVAVQAEQSRKKFFLDEIFSYQTLITFRKLIYDGYTLQTPSNGFKNLVFVKEESGEPQEVGIQSVLYYDEYPVSDIFSKLHSDDILVLEQAKLIALIRFCNKPEDQRIAENEKLNEVFTVRQSDFDVYADEIIKQSEVVEKPAYIIKDHIDGEEQSGGKKQYLNNKQKAFLGIYLLIVLITGLLWYFVFR